MPFTFLSEQAPALWVRERWPGRVDGLALVVGSMAPDLAYLTRGWGFGPDGIALWFDGHRFQNLLVLTIGSFVLTWLVRHVVLPVLPLALPAGGVLHLRDYWYLAGRRHRWWVTYGSALVGAAIHLAIDVVIHPDEPVVGHVAALRSTLFTIGGHRVHVYGAIDVVLSVILAGLAVRWFVQVGARRAFRPTPPAGSPPSLPTAAGAVLWAVVAVGCIGGVAYAIHRVHTFGAFATYDTSTAAIAFAWVAFGAVVVACLVVRPFVARSSVSPVPSPESGWRSRSS